MNDKHAVRKACEICGGITALANGIDVTPPAVSQWINGIRRVPVERCIQVEKITNGAVRCEDLRPDIDWHILRSNKQDEAA